jgi:hypothetical protein
MERQIAAAPVPSIKVRTLSGNTVLPEALVD